MDTRPPGRTISMEVWYAGQGFAVSITRSIPAPPGEGVELVFQIGVVRHICLVRPP